MFLLVGVLRFGLFAFVWREITTRNEELVHPFISILSIDRQQLFQKHRTMVYQNYNLPFRPFNVEPKKKNQDLRSEMAKSLKNYAVNPKHLHLLLLSLLILNPPSISILNEYLLTVTFEQKRKFLESQGQGKRVFMPVLFKYCFTHSSKRFKHLQRMEGAMIENIEFAENQQEALETEIDHLLVPGSKHTTLQLLTEIEGLNLRDAQQLFSKIGRDSHLLSSFVLLKFLFQNRLMTNNLFYYFQEHFASQIEEDEHLSDRVKFGELIKSNNVLLSRSLEEEFGWERQHASRVNEEAQLFMPEGPENLEELVRIISGERTEQFLINTTDTESLM